MARQPYVGPEVSADELRPFRAQGAGHVARHDDHRPISDWRNLEDDDFPFDAGTGGCGQCAPGCPE